MPGAVRSNMHLEIVEISTANLKFNSGLRSTAFTSCRLASGDRTCHYRLYGPNRIAMTHGILFPADVWRFCIRSSVFRPRPSLLSSDAILFNTLRFLFYCCHAVFFNTFISLLVGVRLRLSFHTQLKDSRCLSIHCQGSQKLEDLERRRGRLAPRA
jgi:hypothetical protein